MTLDCIPLAACMPAYAAGDYDTVREVMFRSLTRLAAAGAEFFACPDNTVHRALEAEGPPLPLPGLHIVEVVADEAKARGYRRVGVLGTRFTMDGPLYPRSLGRRGTETEIPDPADREDVDRIIFTELVEGRFTEESRARYQEVIARLAGRGCDAVALSCTEIPLLISPEESPLPTLDSTRLLATAALDVSLGDRPFPAWRGGPLDSDR